VLCKTAKVHLSQGRILFVGRGVKITQIYAKLVDEKKQKAANAIKLKIKPKKK
jgi:hypothetical protein